MTFAQFTNNIKAVSNTFNYIFSKKPRKFTSGNKAKAVKLSAFGNLAQLSSGKNKLYANKTCWKV